jgi:putative peptide maturation system protein
MLLLFKEKGMTSLDEYIALEVNGEPISLQDLLRLAKWRVLAAFIDEATDVAVIRAAAAERGIDMSDEEFQQAADEFRLARDLHEAQSTEDWLASHHLSYADWEALLADQILRSKLRQALTADKVEQYFAEHRLLYDNAAISRLVVSDEDVARELRAQINEEGMDFHALAREYSTDIATRPAGGYAGVVRRAEMEATPEAAIFGSQAGNTVGPFKTESGWELVKVESLHTAILDDAMRETIKTEIFDQWLSERRRRANIRLNFLEAAKKFETDEAVSAD